MSQDDNLTALLNQAIRNRLAEVQTSMPGEIVSYNYKKQMAVVQPSINRVYADKRVEKYPVINNVPVIFPRSGGASMTFPVKRGDSVLLIFTARSIDTWANKGGIVNQDDNRMHSINDAIAIPGLTSFAAGSMAKNNEDVLLTYSGASIAIKPSGAVEVTSPLQISMAAPDVHIDAPNVYMTGDLTVKNDIYDQDGDFGSQGDQRDKYNAHKHIENNVNGQPTDEPQPAYQWD